MSKTVVDEPSPKITRDPKTIGEISNPLLALLADETSRPGDMVVFPDGVRVFRGKPGSRHQLPVFVKLTDTASSDRKLVARIVIGQNPAWSFETGQPSKLAKSDQDVDETGSTRKAGRGR